MIWEDHKLKEDFYREKYWEYNFLVYFNLKIEKQFRGEGCPSPRFSEEEGKKRMDEKKREELLAELDTNGKMVDELHKQLSQLFEEYLASKDASLEKSIDKIAAKQNNIMKRNNQILFRDLGFEGWPKFPGLKERMIKDYGI